MNISEDQKIELEDRAVVSGTKKFALPKRSFIAIIISLCACQIPVLLLNDAPYKHWIFFIICAVIAPPILYSLLVLRPHSVAKWFFFLLVAYAVIHLSYECLVYYTGARATKDTAAFVQCFWNTLHHGTFTTTIDGQYSYVAPESLNHFGRHNSPILFVGLLVFALHPEMITLLILKTLLLVITGWLAFEYVRDALPEERTRLIAAFLPFVLLIQVPFSTMVDFDESPFFPPLFLWSALAFRRDLKWQFLASSLLFAAVKETTIPLLLTWSLIAAFNHRRSFYILVPSIIAVCSYVLSFHFVIPHFDGGIPSPFFADVGVAWQGFGFATIISYVFQTLCTFGWFPVSSLLALLAVPDLIVNSFFSAPMPWTIEIGGRYQLVIECALFLGTIESLPRMHRFLESRLKLVHGIAVSTVFLLSLSLMGLVRAGVSVHSLWDHLHKNWSKDVGCIQLVDESPCPVVADQSLCGYFAKRDVIWASSLFLPKQAYDRVSWYVGKKYGRPAPSEVAMWDTAGMGDEIIVLKHSNKIPPSVSPLSK